MLWGFFVSHKICKTKTPLCGERFQISASDKIITNLINSHEKDPSNCTLFSYCMHMFSLVDLDFKDIFKRYWKLHACRSSFCSMTDLYHVEYV
jgi:hypothetical protein